jgi:hypothetical protein
MSAPKINVELKCNFDEKKFFPKGKIYISGPISGVKNNNFEAFEYAFYILFCKGYKPYNPLYLTSDMPPSSTWRDYMRVCIKALMDCDRIYMLCGWWHSRGAWVELLLAKIVGIKVEFQKKK